MAFHFSKLKYVVATVAMFSGAALNTVAANAITITPGLEAVPVSTAFDVLAPGGALGTSYIEYGIDFSFGRVEGVFDDPPLSFSGVSAGGIVDLLSAVDGRIVLLGSLTAAVTNFFYAEAGFADEGTLTLSLFDSNGALIASVLNGAPTGASGRTTFSYSGAGIAFFSISGTDTFGVQEIRLNTPTVSAVPVPAALPLLITAIGGAVALRRRRKSKTA
jgi:hypothetical protein